MMVIQIRYGVCADLRLGWGKSDVVRSGVTVNRSGGLEEVCCSSVVRQCLDHGGSVRYFIPRSCLLRGAPS